jgi:hypothetical protein
LAALLLNSDSRSNSTAKQQQQQQQWQQQQQDHGEVSVAVAELQRMQVSSIASAPAKTAAEAFCGQVSSTQAAYRQWHLPIR